jgi:hypothetical protein
MEDENEASNQVVKENGDGSTAHSESRDMGVSEDQEGRQRNEDDGAPANDQQGQYHVARAANGRQQEVERPDQDGAAEDQMRIDESRRE